MDVPVARPRRPASRLLRAAPSAVVAAAFLCAVVLSWERLGSLYVDTGRELEVPRRLLAGDVLYRDVRYYWGPLAPALNALLYAAFGVSIDTLRWAGMASAAAGTAGVFALARACAGRWAATAAAVAFVFLCAFAWLTPQPIFNFVLPFNFSATYGMVAALWSVHLLLRHDRERRSGPLVGAAGLLAVCLLSKAEVAFAAVAAHAVFAVVRREALGRLHAVAWGGAVAAVLLVYGLLDAASGGRLWADNLAALGNPESRHYVRLSSGIDGWRLCAPRIALSACLFAWLWILALGLSRAAGRRGGRRAAAVAAGVAGAAALAATTAVRLESALRALPFLAAATGGWLLLRARRGDGGAAHRAPAGEPGAGRGVDLTAHAVLSAFAVAALVRIPLTAGPFHYGFYLVVPGLVWVAVLFFDLGPRLEGTAAGAAVFPAVGAGLLVALVVAALRASVPALTAPYVLATGPRGSLRVPAGGPEPAVLALLSRELAHARSAVALPQGAGLLFASGIPTGADGMTSYLPMELPDDAADRALVERWRARPPDVVLYRNQDLRTEFGRAGFGVDYAPRAARWIADHYVPVDPSQPIVVLVPRR